jgi:hypothetical protein
MEVEQLCEREAFRRIQRLSMNLRAPMREVGEAILLVYDGLRSELAAPRAEDPPLSEEANRRVAQLLAMRTVARAHPPPLPQRPPLAPILQRSREDVEAERRAEALLSEFLTQEQRNQLAHEGFVEVPSTLVPGRSYRIPRSGRLPIVYERGVLVCRLCVGPVERLPAADLVLCHLMLITTDEQRYLAIANRAAL